MELKFSLNENDFLEHQLFLASKTDRIKKQRRKSWMLVSFIFFGLSLIFFQAKNMMMVYYFLVVGILSLIFYPIYQKNHYRKHYKKYIRDAYKNRFDQIATIKFEKDFIETSDINSESRINYSAFEEIIEIENYFFLRLKTGESIIIPKKLKFENIIDLKSDLVRIFENYQIKIKEELNWKWR
jgi:hypothetical protein